VTASSPTAHATMQAANSSEALRSQRPRDRCRRDRCGRQRKAQPVRSRAAANMIASLAFSCGAWLFPAAMGVAIVLPAARRPRLHREARGERGRSIECNRVRMRGPSGRREFAVHTITSRENRAVRGLLVSAGVAELVDAVALGATVLWACRFESCPRHQLFSTVSRAAAKPCSVFGPELRTVLSRERYRDDRLQGSRRAVSYGG
jgi:hypothetical protein